MKALIEILKVAAKKHGPETPLTIGHLLNIVKIAEDMKTHEREISEQREEKQHHEIMNEISYLGQD